jgi:monoterpene epsilon-lactone hydrolase
MACRSRTPLASPLYTDLAGLPPLLIQVGTAEVLLNDSMRLAERATKSGVKVKLDQWRNMIRLFAQSLRKAKRRSTESANSCG